MKLDIGRGVLVNPEQQLRDLDRADCEDSLYEFLRNAWKYVDASNWTDGWPIEAVAEHLQAVADGEIKRLIINIPPRCGKSTITSVAFPAWTWAQRNKSPTSGPGVQFLMASYANQLVLRDSVKCRRLIESPWYQELWGDRFKLNSDQNTKSRFSNDKGGERLITSVGAAVTGEGGSVIVVDDANSASEAFSEANIEATKEWWDGTMSTRLNDQKTGAYVIIQQRLAEDDLTGHILEREADGWTHLCLPMRYEPDRAFVTGIGWEDPRNKPGELLWPERFGDTEVNRLERALGPFAAAGQLQQRPEPAGGGVIKREWWQLWPDDVYPPMDFILASLDTAYTTKEINDASAMTIWGVFSTDSMAHASRFIDEDGRPQYMDRAYNEQAPKVMMMYAWQARLEIHELVDKIAKTCKSFKVDKLLIENKASGISVAQELRRLYSNERFSVQLHDPKSIDKLSRLYSVQHLFSEGMIYAPDKEWADMVMKQVGQFPKGKHDDLCLIGDTIITTKRGNIKLSEVNTNDKVLTPIGWKRVIDAGMTGSKPVITRDSVTGTGNHPVFCWTGWKELDTVAMSENIAGLSLCDLIRTIRLKPWSSTASSTNEWVENDATTYRNQKPMPEEGAQRGCTSLFGNTSPINQFLMAMKSITSTAILLIAVLRIWSAYQKVCIGDFLKKCLRVTTSISRLFDRLLQRGTGRKRGGLGIVKMLKNLLISLGLQKFISYLLKVAYAGGAEVNSLSEPLPKSSAQTSAQENFQDTIADSIKKPTHITYPVYNLTVEDAHCYYANGKLVHNCDTVSMSLRHLRELGMIVRSQERIEEIEGMKTYPGGNDVPLYPA